MPGIRDQGSGIVDSGLGAPKRARESRKDGAAPPALRAAAVAGCRQDMQDQPKMIPQRGSEFFADHRGARPQVVNTVARGQLREDSYFYTGVVRARTAIAKRRT
jgi:hypothetical protein